MNKEAENKPAVIADEEKQLKKIDFFGLSDAKIQEYKENYTGLTIAGIDDKDGYKAVSEGLKTLVSVRNKIDKHRLAINKYVNTEAKRVTDELAPLEADLKSKKDFVDTALQKREMEKFKERTDRLLAAGYKYDGLVYQLGNAVYSPDMIKKMPDDILEATIKQAAELSEKVKAQKAQQDKIDAQLKAEKDELERQKAAVKLQEDYINKKSELIQRQQKGEIVAFTCEIMDGKIHFTTEYPNAKPEPIATSKETTDESHELDAERGFYIDGFNYCRQLVIGIINSPDKITRQILIEKIEALKP